MIKRSFLVFCICWSIVFWWSTAFAFTLPDTGQTECYDEAGNIITCPGPGQQFYGQDGNYTINPPSYKKLDSSGNELPDSATSWAMVRDNVTGLIWEKKTDDGGIHDKDDTYTWQNAQDVFIANLNASSFGGYTDWRVPTIRELDSIAFLGTFNPAIDTDFFPETSSSHYWSSNAGAGSQNNAWGIDFDNNNNQCSWLDRLDSNYVRAVRGGQSDKSYVDNGDGTVTDRNTGLMWQQETAGRMNWESALGYCEGLSLAGYDDWRLPNRKELRSIQDFESSPCINTDFFPDNGSSYWKYWSSTTNAYYTNGAWYISFSWGEDAWTHKGFSHNVRAVRTAPVQIDGGYNVTSELWAKAVLQVPANPVTLIWQEVGRDITPSGDQVVSGYFYADPNDFAYGSRYNPEVFVKIYIAMNGWCNIAFNHVTVDDVTVYSAHNYSGTRDKTGTVSLTSRLAEHRYDGVGIDTSAGVKGRLSPIGATETGGGYIINSGLWEKAVLQTPGGPVTLKWKEVGADNTPTGARVVSGYFYADPADFAYGSEYNPELFVKIYIDPNGWANIASNHVTVDNVDISSSHNYDGTPDQTGVASLINRLVEHQYTGVTIE